MVPRPKNLLLSMKSNVKSWLLYVMILFALSGCGTLEVGIETSPTPAPTAQSTSTPIATATPIAPPESTRTPVPVSPTATEPAPVPTETPAPDRITFPVGGNTFAFTARLVRGEPQRYVLRILAQQTMSITTGSNVTITVLTGDNNFLQPSVSSPGLWQGTLPQTGDYTIVLLGQGLVTVTIEIPPQAS
jgi:hypothetical protein